MNTTTPSLIPRVVTPPIGDNPPRATLYYWTEEKASGRNKRNVWTINFQPYPGTHFATWPEKLVEPMIKAGTSEKGVRKRRKP